MSSYWQTLFAILMSPLSLAGSIACANDFEEQVTRQILRVYEADDKQHLSQLLKEVLSKQSSEDSNLRDLLYLRSNDPSMIRLQRQAVKLLGRRPTLDNIEVLLKRISAFRHSAIVTSSNVVLGRVQLSYPGVNALVIDAGPKAVLPVLNRVARVLPGDLARNHATIDLELMAYTVLAIRRYETRDILDESQSFNLVRRRLIEDLNAIHAKYGKRRPKDVERFSVFLREIDIDSYKYAKGKRFPKSSVLYKWNDDEQRGIFLPYEEGWSSARRQ